MKYKIIALDIDGTLVRNNGELSPAVQEGLIRAQRDYGMRVILASGRPTPALTSLAKALELDRYSGYLLPYNGGRAYNARALSHPIVEHTLPEGIVPELYSVCQEMGACILTYTDTELVSERINDPYVQLEVAITKMPTRELKDFVQEAPQRPTKCLATGSPELIKRLEEVMRKRFGSRIAAFRSSPNFLELVPLGVNKGNTLSRLLERLDYDRSELIAVGDSYNDLEMIQLAGLGVAMANADEAIKSCADYVTLSNEEDGVLHLLHKYLFDAHEDSKYTPADVDTITPGTLLESLGIKCTRIAKGYVEGTMPVDERTAQPLGIIHGGANLAFAETLAGLGSLAYLESDEMQVGAQVSGNHISSAVIGDVMVGKASIMHKGRSTHVWSVEVYSERSGKLIHTSRILNSILRRR